MANYHYRSEPAILLKNVSTKEMDLLKGLTLYIENPDDMGESRLVWAVSHGMSEKPDVKCPITGTPAIKTMLGIGPAEFWIRGNGLAKDIAGARRDMNLHKLTTDDPYPTMREPGEADDLAHRLRRGGKYNPKTQYFQVP